MSELVLNNVKVNKNAKKEEVSAFLLLNKYLFQNHNVVIGDNVSEHQPDIFTEDREIGLEVVTCEPENIYRNTAHKRGDIGYNFEKSDLDTREKRSKYSCYLNEYKYYLTRKNSKPSTEEAEEYYESMKTVLNSKFSKLNNGNYDSCKQRDLIVLSNFAHKDFINIKKIFSIYQSVKKDYAKKFDNVFLMCSEGMFNMDTHKNINLITDVQTLTSKPKTTEMSI